MNRDALGVIETVGMAAAIEAADSCLKSANVELIGYELTRGYGLVTIKIRGNVGAVTAAIEAAKASAARVNQVCTTLIIPRPAANLDVIIESDSTIGIKHHIEDSVEEKINQDIQQVDQILDDKKILEINDENDDDFQGESETLVSNNLVLVDPTENEGFGEEKVSNEKDKDEELIIDNESLNEQESDEVCNICHDPICTRKKGQSKTWCINYKGTRR